ncbi:uncharacterized conserved protein [Hahella chejuensis KCTC 2396]|uniref:Uncharacterized conserved protein n=1 Tax=Hahella chejuensis (strain KCTC 2396) TaxID=349521 RepID=Q2SHT3_HAHCH|nr:formylglycine-generating enzyme family protein [Hahella chejuensis]ABC29791.1 uncharacterized conserved protein [Hahella chejuensis KCTC 2396]
MSSNRLQVYQDFLAAIDHCRESFDEAKFREAFRALFRGYVNERKHHELEGLYSKLLDIHLPTLDYKRMSVGFGEVEHAIEENLTHFKSIDWALFELNGINIIYYWTPPKLVSIELYMCSTYEENGDIDFFGCGEFDKIDYKNLEKYGFPEHGDYFEYSLASKFLQVFIFVRAADLMKKHGLDYVPFSTSLFCGSFDANLPPAPNAEAIKKETLANYYEKVREINDEHQSEIERRATDLLPVNDDDFVDIPEGRFNMGSPITEKGRYANERLHTVLIDNFSLMRAPVTYAQYELYCDKAGLSRPEVSDLEKGLIPVQVSYWEAASFCRWLSAECRHYDYRLPTEAEWEYACRAGTTSAYWYGEKDDETKAYYNPVQTNGLGKIAQFPPNPFGLYDMLGNVSEWCSSEWDENYGGKEARDASKDTANSNLRVTRGGGYSRSAQRSPRPPSSEYIGLRIARNKKPADF